VQWNSKYVRERPQLDLLRASLDDLQRCQNDKGQKVNSKADPGSNDRGAE
jgi:hypothetical protein